MKTKKTKQKKKVVKKKVKKEKLPVTKTLELWIDGKCVDRFSKPINEAIKHAREKAHETSKKVFIVFGDVVKHGFDAAGGKYQLKTAQNEFKKIVEKRKRGGAPKKSERGAITVSFSMAKEDNERFEMYCDKFADGNKSEMFRRILKAWENMMVQVVGEQS